MFELPFPESNTDDGQFALFVTVSSFTPSRGSFVSSYKSKISGKKHKNSLQYRLQ